MAHHSGVLSESSGRWIGRYLLPAGAVLLATALYLYGLENKSLWHDEMGTLRCSAWGGSLWDAISDPLTRPLTPKPPLPFLLTHLFLVLGDRVFILRLQAAVFAILTIPVVHTLGRSMFDRWTGLLAATLLASAPLHVRYAQEARMYALLVFLLTLSLYLFWRAVCSRQGRWWIRFAVAAILALYSHLFALLSLGVMGLFAFWLLARPRGRAEYPFQIRHFVLAMATILLAYAPMVPFLAKGLLSSEGLGGQARPDWSLGLLVGALRLFSGGHDVGLIVCVLLLVVAAGVLAVRRRDTLLLAAMWILLPVAIILFTPFAHAVRVRYFLFALPVYLLLVAYGVQTVIHWLVGWLGRRSDSKDPGPDKLPSAVGALAALLLLGLLVGSSLSSLSEYYVETKQNWRGAVRLVQAQAKPGDLILVRHEYDRAGVLFYAGQQASGVGTWTQANVQVLPPDLGAAFPPGDSQDRWLLVPARERFMPGGELEASIQPHWRFLPPTLLPSSHVPEERLIISPTSFRSLAVVRVVPAEPPAIRFWAKDEALSPGDCTLLRWEVDGVREVYLEGEGVVGHDERRVCPRTTTGYELRVVHRDGTVTRHTVQVAAGGP